MRAAFEGTLMHTIADTTTTVAIETTAAAAAAIDTTTEALAVAFGGHSQYSPRTVGSALAGRLRNTSLTISAPDLVAAYAAWDLARYDEDEDGHDAAVAEFAAGLAL